MARKKSPTAAQLHNAVTFRGAFATRKDANKRAKRFKGATVIRKDYGVLGVRYLVVTPKG